MSSDMQDTSIKYLEDARLDTISCIFLIRSYLQDTILHITAYVVFDMCSLLSPGTGSNLI